MARSAPLCELRADVVVNCPLDIAWDMFTNNALTSSWAPPISKVDCDQPTLAVGVRRRITVEVEGKQGQTVEECTYCEAQVRLDYQIVKETFGFSHMLDSYGFSILFSESADTTTMIMLTRYKPKRVFSSVMTSTSVQQQLRDMMIKLLSGFKCYVEETVD